MHASVCFLVLKIYRILLVDFCFFFLLQRERENNEIQKELVFEAKTIELKVKYPSFITVLKFHKHTEYVLCITSYKLN